MRQSERTRLRPTRSNLTSIAGKEEIYHATALRQKIELKAGLKLLNAKQEVDVAKAEAEALENDIYESKSQQLDELNYIEHILMSE
jgi:hypothetical protein